MPAIGASTTGVGTTSDPRVSVVMGSALLALLLRALLRLVVRLLRAAAQLLDLAGPGDGVELLGRAEGHRRQVAVVGREVDQAGLGRVAVLELLRQRRARTGVERGGEDRGLDQTVLAVDDVQRHRTAAQVGVTD